MNFWRWREIKTDKWLKTPWSSLLTETETSTTSTTELNLGVRTALSAIGVGESLHVTDVMGGSPLLMFRHLSANEWKISRTPLGGKEVARDLDNPQRILESWDASSAERPAGLNWDRPSTDSSFGALSLSEDLVDRRKDFTVSSEDAVRLLVGFVADFHSAESCVFDATQKERKAFAPLWPEEHALLAFKDH